MDPVREAATDDRSVREALTAWAKVFAAPRDFGSLVQQIQEKDEVIERVVSLVVRRDLQEERTPTRRQEPTSPAGRVDMLDVLGITLDELRRQSEFVATCARCRGGGIAPCSGCQGSGRARCGECLGSGKVRSTKSSRMINCKSCRASGTRRCSDCGGEGSMTCGACAGGGRQTDGAQNRRRDAVRSRGLG